MNFVRHAYRHLRSDRLAYLRDCDQLFLFPRDHLYRGVLIAGNFRLNGVCGANTKGTVLAMQT